MRSVGSLLWTILLNVPPASGPDHSASQESVFEQKILATIPDGIEVEPWRIQFAPNGRSVVYGANKGGERHKEPWIEGGIWWIVVGEKRSEDFDAISHVVFAPDERKLAFAAKKGSHWSVWCDGKRQGGTFTWIGRILFSPDGKTLAYEGWQDSKAFLVVGETKLDSYDGIHSSVFSPDGKSIAYAAKEHDRWIVVSGDRKSSPYDSIGGILFSPDNKTLVYSATQGDSSFVVVGDKRGEGFEQVRADPVFSPDGTELAYPVFDGVTERIVVGARKERGFDGVSAPAFSPNGKSLAYAVHVGGKRPGESSWLGGDQFVITNGKRGPSFDWIRPPIKFSPDGSQAAYVATIGEKYVVAVGDCRSEEFDWIDYTLVFSRDGKRVAFGARKGRELWWRVLRIENK